MTSRSLQRTWRVEGPAYALDVQLEDERLVGTLDGPDGALDLAAQAHRTGPEAVVVRYGGRAHRAVVVRDGACLWVAMDGHTYQLCVEAPGRPGGPLSCVGAERVGCTAQVEQLDVDHLPTLALARQRNRVQAPKAKGLVVALTPVDLLVEIFRIELRNRPLGPAGCSSAGVTSHATPLPGWRRYQQHAQRCRPERQLSLGRAHGSQHADQ